MFLGFIVFSLIWTIVIGLVIGIIAKAIMPGRDPGGFVITTLLGIAGSFVGSFLGVLPILNWFPHFLLSIGGAVILLVAYRMLANNRSTI